ncbi:MAG TPA: helix-hairpin-helix domain-containing protein [Chitinophagaceae bacterium]|nr:helix-hairpin-helix domain-containing protein [Chitinophagaceae bacterium]
MDNGAIADNFSLLSKLMDIHGENSFKSKTYSVAAFNIEKLPMQLHETPREKIFGIKGIGDSVGKKVIEMLDTGELKTLTEYLEKTPAGIIEMLRIKGIGPKKINTIWKELEVESIGELLYACNENRLLLYKGFGEKTQNNIRDSIEFYLQNQGSYLYAQIESYAHEMNEKLAGQFPKNKISFTGAFRRQIEIIDVLEWCVTIDSVDLKKYFIENGFETIEEDAEHILFKGKENVKTRFHLTGPSNFWKKLFQTSCSEDFLMGWEKQFSISPEAESEEDIFNSAGVPFIIPALRENDSILSNTKENNWNKIIQVPDVRSVIHSHSNWSDGMNTIEEMANDLIRRGYEFLVISDHSKSAFYANGLTVERIKEQHRYVNELNSKLAPFRIFKSIECDILNDGSLDYSDDILGTFDLVISSIHSNLKMNEEKAMMRLLGAIKNPYTTILGHMTGRLLLSRNGYPVDHKKIIDACAENNVVIELNAHPRRLDIDWRWIDYAIKKNVLISIDPDAHTIKGFNDVKYGVLVAQKGGLTKKQNLSSFTLKEFEDYLEKIRKLKGI